MTDQRTTPLPWFASKTFKDDYDFDEVTIGPYEVSEDSDHVEETIARVSGINHDATANAAFIVRACNAHADLLVVLHKVREAVQAGDTCPVCEHRPHVAGCVVVSIEEA